MNLWGWSLWAEFCFLFLNMCKRIIKITLTKWTKLCFCKIFTSKSCSVCNTDFLALQSRVQSLCFTHFYASRPLSLLTEWVQPRPGPLASSSGQVLSRLGTSSFKRISYICCKIQYLYNSNVFYWHFLGLGSTHSRHHVWLGTHQVLSDVCCAYRERRGLRSDDVQTVQTRLLLVLPRLSRRQ